MWRAILWQIGTTELLKEQTAPCAPFSMPVEETEAPSFVWVLQQQQQQQSAQKPWGLARVRKAWAMPGSAVGQG